MITRDLTEFKCDACCATKTIHEESRYNDEPPADWLAPFHNSIGEDISLKFNGERIDIRLKGVCFCSAKCAADYIQKALIVAIDNIKTPKGAAYQCTRANGCKNVDSNGLMDCAECEYSEAIPRGMAS